MNVAGLHVAVLGAGESGECAARLLHAEGARVTVLDSGTAEKLANKQAAFSALGISLITDSAAANDAAEYDLGVLSPGIDPAVPLVQNFRRKQADLIGELELADQLCGRPVIGITGTNGKTTTTQLVETMLLGCGVKTAACGNIGPAFSGKVMEGRELDVLTVEISSFQLEEIRHFRPQIAVWLGFAPDHLDRYPDIESYYAAKVRIFENQTPEDWAIVNFRDRLPLLKARRITFSAYARGGDFDLRDGTICHLGTPVLALADTRLTGSHNAENLMATMGVGLAWGLEFEAMRGPLCAYRPLAHRCEFVRSVSGVDYINDSKATNLDAMEKALAGETRRVVLIAGGKDKGFEFGSVTDLVAEKCRCAVLLGDMADRIEQLWGSRLPCHNAGRSLAQAVQSARAAAQPGDLVLFSPGTSSFDMFKNYGDRGDQFRQLVQQLEPSEP